MIGNKSRREYRSQTVLGGFGINSGLFETTSIFLRLRLWTHQRLQLRVVDEVELWDEVVVVFVAGVDVGLCTHAADAVEVVDVNVHKDPEQTAQDLLANLLEVLGERNT